jgi:hypothetical protein
MAKQVLNTQTDEEIRAEFDAAAARQRQRNRILQAETTETTETGFLDYSSAGAVRKR